MGSSYDPAWLQVDGSSLKHATTIKPLESHLGKIVTTQAVSSQVFRMAIEESTMGIALLTGEQPIWR
ncbi:MULTISPECIES: hypothetical protein [Paenibacillus]|uniref:hypothetical protein n=1 Tax=Paenibacillus TaxID=44249 RepID=UPI00159630F7|nr:MULTISPECIES: hypothetical protein [Paenibacillus]